MMARAIAILCFCPPDRRMRRSPTRVSNPEGREVIKSYAIAVFAAFSISDFFFSSLACNWYVISVLLNLMGICVSHVFQIRPHQTKFYVLVYRRVEKHR